MTHLGRCPSCDGPSHGGVRRLAGLELHRCKRCDLVYSDPQPRRTVDYRYESEYDLADHFAEREPRKRVLFERRLDRLGPPPAEGRRRLCDVGCGDGLFLEMASERGWSGSGVELNPPAARKARERGFEVAEGKLEAIDHLSWRTFDVVTSWDSLEHTPAPREFMRRIERLLAPGGRLGLTTLNRRSLVGMTFQGRWSMVVPDHFTYWNRKSLGFLVRAVGLDVADLHSAGLGRDFVRWMDHRRLAGDGSPSPAAHRTWDTGRATLVLERALNFFLDATMTGVEIGAFARKPR